MSDVKSPALLPCPFCGSPNIDPEGWASIDRKGPACDDCSGCADTVELWNSRPAPTSPPAEALPSQTSGAEAWRYSINYGPEGEANYAMVYDISGDLVGNLKTHHAISVVNAVNSAAERSAVCALVPPPETYGGSPDEPWGGKMPASPASKAATPLKWRHVDVEQYEAHAQIGTYEVCGNHWSFTPTLRKAGGEMNSVADAKGSAQAHRDKFAHRRATTSEKEWPEPAWYNDRRGSGQSAGAVEFVEPGAKKAGDRISLPGGWYFERYNDDGVVFSLRTPSGRGFGIKGTGCGLYTETAQSFAKAMWQTVEVRS